jgi:hypothetical protein
MTEVIPPEFDPEDPEKDTNDGSTGAKKAEELARLGIVVGLVAVLVAIFALTQFRILSVTIIIVASLPMFLRLYPSKIRDMIEKWRHWDILLSALLGIMVLVAGFGVLHKVTGPRSNPLVNPTSPVVPHTSTLISPPDSSPPNNGTPSVLRHGVLVLLGNGTGYDLDSPVSDWSPSIGVPWQMQNIEYVPDFTNGDVPGLLIAQAPATDVLMGYRRNWSYQDCANATFDPSYNPTNPNVPDGPALDIGHGICIETRNTSVPLKNDGGHLVLIVVKARSSSSLTIEVTVWK